MRNRKVRHVLLIVSCMAIVLCATTCRAESHRVVLVVADYISLSDLTQNVPPHLAKLVSESGIGLISLGAAGSRTFESGYATAGTGAASWADLGIDEAYSRSEAVKEELGSARDVIERRTGDSSPSAIVHLEMALLGETGNKRYSSAHPGALADALEAAGKKTAVFGNADTATEKRRRAVAIAATGSGSVEVGDVSARITKSAPFSPQGFSTDVPKLAENVEGALKTAHFIVVDFGDTARVELARRDLPRRAYRTERRNALLALDSLVGKLLEGRGKNATLILLAVAPPKRERRDPKQLAPILIHEPGSKPGCLISPTTRTEGLIAGFDIAPTVLARLGLRKSAGMIGTPIEAVNASQTEVKRLDELVRLNSILLWPILGVIGGLGIAAATLGALAVIFRRRLGAASKLTFSIILVFAASSPLAMIIATCGTPQVIPYLLRLFGAMVLLTAASFALASLLKRALADRLERMQGALPYVVLAILTTVAILSDAYSSGHMIRFTIINAAGFEGYRFYGVGNEYMGVCLGMGMAAILWIRECFPNRRTLLALISCVIVLALGWPRFGANAGGLLAAVVGLGLVNWSSMKQRLSMWAVLVSLVAAFLVLAGIGILDSMVSKTAQSHIGLATSVSGREGLGFLAAMALRKVTMNLRLIGTSQSEWALAGSIPFFACWFLGMRAKVNLLLSERPQLRLGLISALIGTAVAFLFNDSGVVAAGLMFGYLAMPVLYSVVNNEQNYGPGRRREENRRGDERRVADCRLPL